MAMPLGIGKPKIGGGLGIIAANNTISTVVDLGSANGYWLFSTAGTAYLRPSSSPTPLALDITNAVSLYGGPYQFKTVDGERYLHIQGVTGAASVVVTPVIW